MRSTFVRSLVLLITLVTACTPSSGGTLPPAPTPGAPAVAAEEKADAQTIRVAFSFVYANLSPAIAAGFPHLALPMYDTLVQFGPKYELQPGIATKWAASDDGLTWRFTIRDDMTWPNGDKLTADDVAFTLQTALDKNWPARSYFGSVTKVSAADAKTVEVVTRVPDATIPNGGPLLWVVPKKYYETAGADGFSAKPMGSGPYEVVDFKPGISIQYKKRTAAHAYRKVTADQIFITAIVDASQKINGIRTSELDFSHLLLNAEQIDQAKANGLNARRLEGDTSIAILIPQGGATARNTPLTDKRVRQALNYAVDKDSITKTALRGSHEPSGQIGLATSQMWDPSIQPWPYDPKKAKELLAEAGYPNGFPLTMDFSAAAMSTDIAIAVQAALKEIGIDLTVRTMEAAQFVDAANARNNQVRGDLFATTFGETNGFFSGSRGLLGCNRPQPGNAAVEFYCNPAWDQAFDQAVQERDPAKRAALYKRLVQLPRDDVAAIFFATRSSYVVQGPKMRGFEPPVPGYYNLDNVFKVK